MLKRYDKEGLGGLKDRIKTGRPPELSEAWS
ncbi:MAG TPA: helix-turn-helix domain-containing protein [Candidatus Nitrosocosmicus sp.]